MLKMIILILINIASPDGFSPQSFTLANGERIEYFIGPFEALGIEQNPETWVFSEKDSENEYLPVYLNSEGGLVEHCPEQGYALFFEGKSHYENFKTSIVAFPVPNERMMVPFQIFKREILANLLADSDLEKIATLSDDSYVVYRLKDGRILEADALGRDGIIYRDLDEFQMVKAEEGTWSAPVIYLPGFIED